ncbi:MAG TPA: hypothetical protein VEU30_01040 [Thermoanaerobaculia bacterium]|nr:hypothetical protein [Thermoanaerobaculia bacterium]
MRRVLPILLLSFLTLSASAAGHQIACADTWAPNTTEQALIRLYGRANVSRGMIYIAEGEEERGTIIYENNPAWRAEIVWKDKRNYRNPEWVRIPAGSRWTTFGGLRIGLTMPQVEKINARPFKFYGFDWDYGGGVTNWRAGRLDGIGAPCGVQVHFDRVLPERLTAAQEKAVDATSGDTELLSSNLNVRALKIEVVELVVQYP